MATDDAASDTSRGDSPAGDEAGVDAGDADSGDVTEAIDGRLIDLLSWLLDTETKARIFVRLRQRPASTSEEIAEGTGLYPSTVREALAELHDDDVVTRTKREAAGAGNNPYEYESIPPADLVEGAVDRVQTELNTVFNLDRRLDRADGEEATPVSIVVDGDAGGTESSADDDGPGRSDGAADRG